MAESSASGGRSSFFRALAQRPLQLGGAALRVAAWARAAEARSRSPRPQGPEPQASSSPGPQSAARPPRAAFQSMAKCFEIIPDGIIGSMRNALGDDCVDRALRKLGKARLTTSFAGSGMPELAIECMAAQVGVEVAHGPSIEWEWAPQQVLHCLNPDRCVLGDICGLVGKVRTNKIGEVRCKSFPTTAYCYTHGRMCSARGEVGDAEFELQVAGPPCPPWSAFGIGLGTDDHRYEYMQKWACLMLHRLPNIIIFENVSRFEKQILFILLGKVYTIHLDELDPSFFGCLSGDVNVVEFIKF
eukprot:Skav231939  [mRNA]  locus=scaffold2742:12418:13320:- [translate_table: standard]